MLRATGHGTLAVHAPGSILVFDLAAGEQRSVDNGHVVAWSANMHYEVNLTIGLSIILTTAQF